MRVLWSLLLLAACGPSLPDDADTGATTGTGDPTGDPVGDPPTTGDAPPNPTTATTVPRPDETTGDPTTGDPTTGEPEPPLQVLPLLLLSDDSALADVPHWQPPPDSFCDGPQMNCLQFPEVGAGRLLIDGVLAPPDTTTAPLGAHVAVLFPFKSCTLGCGRYEYVAAAPSGKGTGNGLILPGLPCETADANVWLALDLGLLADPGNYFNSLKVTDVCDHEAEEKSLAFTPL